MANVTKTSVATMTPVQVAQMALGALAGNLQLAKVANRNWEPMFASQGEVVDVPIRGTVAVNDKTADTPVTEQVPVATKVSITLSAHKEATILFEDVARALANQDIIGGYMADASTKMAEAIEVAGFVEAYTNFTANADIGAAGVDISDDLVLGARKVMKDAKVPQNEPIYVFLSTKDMLALLLLPKYSEADKVGDGGAMLANAPMQFRKYGMTLVESQYVQKVSTLTHCLGVSPTQGLALACRPLPLAQGVASSAVGGEGEAAGLGVRVTLAYRPDKLAHQLTLDVLFGWKVIRNEFGIDINT